MPLKMPPPIYKKLETAILSALDAKGKTYSQIQKHYTMHGIGTDPLLRCRWDLLSSIPPSVRHPIMEEAYKAECNDDHIDTALRHIVKKLA